MFEAAGTSVGINLAEPGRAKHNEKDIYGALEFLEMKMGSGEG